MVDQILPIQNTTMEVAQFDIQKIRNPEIEGTEYQEGPQLGFWNVRENVLTRDGHLCQWCKGKSNDHILNVHHIESRKTGGDSPDNLIALCETCHASLHKTHQLKKSHIVDARCISAHPLAASDGTWYLIKCVRRNNRQLHKATIRKGGMRQRNTAPK
jgi:hypothetical protein